MLDEFDTAPQKISFHQQTPQDVAVTFEHRLDLGLHIVFLSQDLVVVFFLVRNE